MKQELLKTISNLERDDMFAITVESINESGAKFPIICNATNTEIVEKYGSAKNLFEKIYTDGHKKINVIPKKQNGQNKTTMKFNYKHAGIKNPPFEIEFEPKQATEMQSNVSVMPQQSYVPLNGGLSGADNYRVHDYQRILEENIQVKAKNEIFEKQIKELEKELFKTEILGVKKVETTESQAKLMAAASPYIPLLQTLLLGAKGQVAETPVFPLNSGITQIKQTFINQDDDILNDLLPVLKGFEIVGFENDLKPILLKYNLISNQNAG